MKPIFCAEFSTRGQAFVGLNQALSDSQTHVLEFGQTSGSSILMLTEGPALHLGCEKSIHLETAHRDLVGAYLKMNTPTISKNLCLVESHSFCELLRVCNDLAIHYKFNPVEIFRATNQSSQAWALLTGGQITSMESEEFFSAQITIIDNPNREFLNFLNI